MRAPGRFRHTLVNETRNNSLFRAELGVPEGSMGTSQGSILAPRRLLYCNALAIASPGDVVRDESGVRYLLSFHGVIGGSTIYKAYELEKQVLWARTQASKDLTTGLARDVVKRSLGKIWVATEPLHLKEQMNFEKRVYRILTGADIQADDEVDGLTVRHVVVAQGIRILEAY